MRPLLFALGMILISAMFLPLRPALSAPASPEDRVVKLEQDWLAAEASGDKAQLRQLIADDFMGTGPGGNVLSKHDIVPESGGEGGRLPKSSLRDSTVRIFGDTAVLMGYVATEGAVPPTGFHVTTVYQKRDAGWLIIATHMSR